MSDLFRCLNPESFVVIGGREGSRVVQQSLKFGYSGDIYTVHPKHDDLGGIPCFHSLDELPNTPDSAFVAIPAEPTIDNVTQLREMGTGGVVCYASGFGEVGAHERHQRLLAAAAQMPLVGPNCYGYINALNGAVLWPDQHGMKRVDSGVAIFSGSGNLCVDIAMQKRGLAIGLLVSIGNQALIGLEHCIGMALEDDRVTAIGLHIEGIKNMPLFCEMAIQAAEKSKPIIALKTGRSEMGAKITMSHTATLAGSTGLYDALFDRLGVAQVDNLESFLEALKLVSVVGPLTDNRILSMSCSGGEASLIADLSQNMDLEFPAFKEPLKTSIQSTLNEYVVVDNPFDYHTFIWGDRQRMYATFSEAVKTDVSLAVTFLDYPNIDNCDNTDWVEAGEAFVAACQDNKQNGAVICSLAENMPDHMMARLVDAGVPPLLGLKQALDAIHAATKVGKLTLPAPKIHTPIAETESAIRSAPKKGDRSDRQSITEQAAKDVFAKYGARIPQNGLVRSVAEAVQLSNDIGFPLVLKVSGEGVAHKSELNGVALNITNADQVAIEAQRLLSISDAVLVEEMITDSVTELLIGVSFDPQFGHYLILGFGGTLVELIADRQILLLPTSDNQIKEALGKLKTAPLLNGYRGKPKANLDSVVNAVNSVINYVEKNRETVLEIDINPLMVGENTSTIADALIVERSF